MDSNKTFRIIVIFVTVSILVTISTPVDSKSVPLSHSFVARSLLREFPPSISPSDSESPSSSPSSAVMDLDSPSDSESPSSSPSPAVMDLDSPSDSESPSSSPSPAAMDLDSPAASPEAPAASPEAPSSSPEDPAASPETPAMSPEAPATSPETPAMSPEAPATSPEAPVASPEASAPSLEAPADSPTDSSYEDDYDTSSSPITPKGLLNPSLLSPEIKTICGNTDFPPLCESSISPLLTPLLKPDTSSVLVLAIEASITATKAATAIVEKVDAADCQELYDDAVSNLEDAANAVKSRDIDTANTNLSAAMTDYGTCNDGFEESGEPNPLADVADKLTKMVSNCLAISTTLIK